MPSRDWPALKLAFVTDPNKPSVREYAGKLGIKEKTLQNRAAAERWLPDRDEHWEHVGKKSGEKIADLQATVQARDVAQQLGQIQAMKAVALKFAAGDDETTVVYDKPHEAVAAYERLVKLERLILGDSTEHIEVSDARAFALQLLQIVREEVVDHDVLQRIASRLSAVGAELRGGTPQRPLN